MKTSKVIFLFLLVFSRIVYCQDWNAKLSEGLKERDIKKVKEALKNGANPDEKGFLTYHPLIWATMNGDKEIFEILLQNGADINVKIYGRGFSLLHIAAIYDREDICKILIKKGLDMNAKDLKGETPLMLASIFGNTKVVKLLIKEGADINLKDREGETALFKAARWGRFKICKMLISKGANVNERNYDGRCSDIKERENVGKTVLMGAASYKGDYRVIKLLIKKGADVNANNSMWTALMYAAEEANFEAVKVLVSKGADINLKDRGGQTALDIAAERCNSSYDKEVNYKYERCIKVVEYLKSKMKK